MNNLFKRLYMRIIYSAGVDIDKCVYCKIKLPKVAKQKWTKLQVHFGQSCKLSHTGSREWCSA